VTAPELDAARVVGVRREALTAGRRGAAVALALVAILAATHPSWRVLRTFVTFEVVTALWAAGRAAWKLRGRLDDAEPLPSHAVEVRPRLRPLRPRDTLTLATMAAVVGAAVVFAHLTWLLHYIAAGVIAAGIAVGLFEPLAETLFVSRWERAHGGARLYRRFRRDRGEYEELFVADRVVPGE
jgi:hypothetical protein